jgi:hypothetical protein
LQQKDNDGPIVAGFILGFAPIIAFFLLAGFIRGGLSGSEISGLVLGWIAVMVLVPVLRKEGRGHYFVGLILGLFFCGLFVFVMLMGSLVGCLSSSLC